MLLRNKALSSWLTLFLFSAAYIALGQSQPQPAQPPQSAPPQAQPGQTAQPIEQQGDPMAEPLTPGELVVPSNAALAAMAPAPVPTAPGPTTTATATTPNATTPNPQPGPRPMQQTGRSGIFTMKAEVDEVILHATVVDDRQRLVTNLDRSDFTVYENGQMQPITSFRHEDVPVAVGILVDDSGSMRDKRPAVEQAALNFVRSSNPDDRVFVVNFSDPQSIYIDADFTSNIPKLKAALENIDSRGETALYDAVVASADHVMKEPNIDHKLSKRVLLIVTDGWDNASAESLEQAVRHVAVDGGPTIYTIGLLDEDSKKKGKRALNELAEQTGGVSFLLDPKDLGRVDQITQQIAHDIRNQYTIGYKKNPSAAPGYRTIKVVARAHGYHDLQVRTRSGYFPGQEQAENAPAR